MSRNAIVVLGFLLLLFGRGEAGEDPERPRYLLEFTWELVNGATQRYPPPEFGGGGANHIYYTGQSPVQVGLYLTWDRRDSILFYADGVKWHDYARFAIYRTFDIIPRERDGSDRLKAGGRRVHLQQDKDFEARFVAEFTADAGDVKGAAYPDARSVSATFELVPKREGVFIPGVYLIHVFVAMDEIPLGEGPAALHRQRLAVGRPRPTYFQIRAMDTLDERLNSLIYEAWTLARVDLVSVTCPEDEEHCDRERRRIHEEIAAKYDEILKAMPDDDYALARRGDAESDLAYYEDDPAQRVRRLKGALSYYTKLAALWEEGMPSFQSWGFEHGAGYMKEVLEFRISGVTRELKALDDGPEWNERAPNE